MVYRQLLGKLQFLIASLVKALKRINAYVFSSLLFQELMYTITVGAVVLCKTFCYSFGCFQMSSFLINFFHSFLKNNLAFCLY